MAKPEFFVTPGYGEVMRDSFHFSQAVRIGDRIELAGQTGCNDQLEIPASVEEEISQAFANVERTLQQAGASWASVYRLVTYHVVEAGDPAIAEPVLEYCVSLLRERIPGHAPIWTAVGVPGLALPGMRIEVVVSASVADTQ